MTEPSVPELMPNGSRNAWLFMPATTAADLSEEFGAPTEMVAWLRSHPAGTVLQLKNGEWNVATEDDVP